MTLNVQLRCHANDPVQNITSYAHDLFRPEISFYKQDLSKQEAKEGQPPAIHY